jgi:hypothetical protein
MSILEKRRAEQAAGGDNRPTLTKSMFKETYAQHLTLVNFAETGRLDDVQDMEQYFTNVLGKGKYSYSRKIRTDKGGLKYQFVPFLESNGPEGLKVILLDNMAQFIRDYHQGKFWINFTFEELLAESTKA